MSKLSALANHEISIDDLDYYLNLIYTSNPDYFLFYTFLITDKGQMKFSIAKNKKPNPEKENYFWVFWNNKTGSKSDNKVFLPFENTSEYVFKDSHLDKLRKLGVKHIFLRFPSEIIEK